MDALASHADAVIIDISHPTESLLWEIRQLRREGDVRCVLVCAADAATALQGSSDDTRTNDLLSLIQGDKVLVYPAGRANPRQFARSLRNHLDRTATGRA